MCWWAPAPRAAGRGGGGAGEEQGILATGLTLQRIPRTHGQEKTPTASRQENGRVIRETQRQHGLLKKNNRWENVVRFA